MSEQTVAVITGPKMVPPASQLQGFTLIELLVVIGIISILIAIAITAMSSVRAAANRTVCASNLHQVGVLGSCWAGAHGGYLPLDGKVSVDPSQVGFRNLPEALGDASKTRYDYILSRNGYSTDNESPFELSPTSFIAGLSKTALGRESNALVPDELWFDHVQQLRALRIFQCPAVSTEGRQAFLSTATFDAAGAGPTLSVNIDQNNIGYYDPWWTGATYATNGLLLGFDFRTPTSRLAGKVGEVRLPSRTLLMSDATGGWIKVWDTAAAGLSSLSLSDIVQEQPSSNGSGPLLDFERHHKACNVLYVDGHVETLDMSAGTLSRVLISNRTD